MVMKKYCILYKMLEGKIFKKWKYHFLTLYGHKASSVYKQAMDILETSKYEYELSLDDVFVQYKKR